MSDIPPPDNRALHRLVVLWITSWLVVAFAAWMDHERAVQQAPPFVVEFIEGRLP